MLRSFESVIFAYELAYSPKWKMFFTVYAIAKTVSLGELP
jgi:hypothetical protein